MEWAATQVGSRGLAPESSMVEKAQSWMISTAAGDLTGEIHPAR